MIDIEEIRKNPDKQDWVDISVFQILSEDFIREFSDKVNWYCISCCQILSKDFIIQHFDKICISCLLKNNNISIEIKNYVRALI